mgnify:FL=1
MKDFLFRSPTKVKFGTGTSFQLYEIFEEMGVKKPFVVTGKHVGKTDEFAKIIASLEEKGYSVQLFTDTQPDSPIDVCDAAAQVLKDSGCDVCVAVGGGSVIDTAKAMCMLVTNEGSVKEYLFGGSKTVENPSLPLIAVPTTAGSGSEVSAASVITDEENDIKLSVSHEYLMPKFAIVDPLQQLHMPAFITATTGMDALTHAIESYVSLNANPFSDAYGEMAIRLIGENIRTAVHDPMNLEAREKMAVASTLAGTAFVNGGLGAVHGISQAMGGVAHVAHGTANSMMLPYVIEKNIPGNLEKFGKIAELLGENVSGLSKWEAAHCAITAVQKLAADLRIPKKLTEVGVTKEMFPAIIKGTMEYRLLAVNPVKIMEQDVEKILEKAYE